MNKEDILKICYGILRDYLTRNRLRNTLARNEILKVISDQDCSFTASDIYYLLDNDDICIVTVYHSFKLFEKAGLIKKDLSIGNISTFKFNKEEVLI